MRLFSANVPTDRRNLVPILSMIAGEAIGNPRCLVKNHHTCPLVCSVGTYPFR